MSAPAFHTATPAQLRSFRLLTLAQMVHLESKGIGMTGRSAKRQALEALDLTSGTGAGLVETTELIGGLRYLAMQSLGVIDAEPPTRPLASPSKGAAR